jgi:formamidopyrimidine-DNA glycosylase
MPELPEVETVRRGLRELIIGRKIKAVNHDTPKSFPNAPKDVEEFLVGASVADVRRRAKVLLINGLHARYSPEDDRPAGVSWRSGIRGGSSE